MGDNLKLSPQGALEFAVSGKQASTKLRAVNNGTSAVALKVKTTQPSWYYVRPNQIIVAAGAGQTVDIEVTLVENESKRAFAMAKKGSPVDLSRHRFMVMSCTLPADAAEEINNMDDDEKKQALAALWDDKAPKEDKRGAGPVKNTKMKVVYTIVDDQVMPSQRGLDSNGNTVDDTGAPVPSAQSVSSRVEEMRKNLSELSEAVKASEVPDNFNACIDLFKQLRQKYAVLEDFTMSQMGELDAVKKDMNDLDNAMAKAKREMTELKARAAAEGKDKQKAMAVAVKGEKNSMLAGVMEVRLPLLIVGLGVIAAYLAGRMFPPIMNYSDLPAFLQR